jgi:hypothetical protein
MTFIDIEYKICCNLMLTVYAFWKQTNNPKRKDRDMIEDRVSKEWFPVWTPNWEKCMGIDINTIINNCVRVADRLFFPPQFPRLDKERECYIVVKIEPPYSIALCFPDASTSYVSLALHHPHLLLYRATKEFLRKLEVIL